MDELKSAKVLRSTIQPQISSWKKQDADVHSAAKVLKSCWNISSTLVFITISWVIWFRVLASSIPPNPKHITQWQHTSFHRISTQALLQLCKHSTPQCMLFTSTHLMPNKHTGRKAKQNCQWKILWFVAFFGRWGWVGQNARFPHLAMIQEEHLSYPTWRWPFDWLERNQL